MLNVIPLIIALLKSGCLALEYFLKTLPEKYESEADEIEDKIEALRASPSVANTLLADRLLARLERKRRLAKDLSNSGSSS